MESLNRLLHCWILLISLIFVVNGQFPTTLEGPFKPVSVPVNYSIIGKVTSLPDDNNHSLSPEIEFQPQQISLSLSSDLSSVWVSWITGICLVHTFLFVIFTFSNVLLFMVPADVLLRDLGFVLYTFFSKEFSLPTLSFPNLLMAFAFLL